MVKFSLPILNRLDVMSLFVISREIADILSIFYIIFLEMFKISVRAVSWNGIFRFKFSNSSVVCSKGLCPFII